MESKFIRETMSRIDEVKVAINNAQNLPITLFARDDVHIEEDGLKQLLSFVSLQDTLNKLNNYCPADKPFWGDIVGEIKSIVLTPDFHKGSGIPVGTVVDTHGFIIPQAIGNDVCCGMRLLITDIDRDEFVAHQNVIEPLLRKIFFQGQRELPLSSRQRDALLREGLWGLNETYADNAGVGLWNYYDAEQQSADLIRVHFQGVLPAKDTFAFGDFIRSAGVKESYDSQIGSVGGGNHFVEIQVVDEIIDGATAHEWGINANKIAIMVHSGSVGLGHMVGGHFRDRAKAIYPHGMPHPDHGFYVLPTTGQFAHEADIYLDAMKNAANFAFGNRLFLGLMVINALSKALDRRVPAKLIYDAPHNLIWEDIDRPDHYLHRKGACPALGPEPDLNSPFKYTGHPVIIPGSMGAASYLLAGYGNQKALRSACHGAGRSISRGRARNVDEDSYQQSVDKLKIITPIDPDAFEIRSRRDIMAKYHERLREEAPYAYKPITPVVQTVEDAEIARRVVKLWPLLTIKG